jgi:hypothetical protein
MARRTTKAPTSVRWHQQLIESQRAGLILLAAVACLGFAARVWLSLTDDGLYWPDEIYQSIEPAHRLVYGYGLISWEYGLGARTWVFPGFLSGLLILAKWLGLADPRQYLVAIRIVMSAIGVSSAIGSYVLARRLGAASLFAACGAAFFALVGPAVYFGPKALSETVSTLPIVFGLALLLPEGAGRSARIAGASLVGLATLLRMHNAVFFAAILVVYAARRRWREMAEAAGVFAVWALALGVLDKLTWGGWFQSVVLYMRFTLGGGGPVTGSSPASYYLEMLPGSMPLAMIAVTVLALAGTARARALAFVTGVFLIAHFITPNKAYRYVLPALPLLGALAALGLQNVLGKRRWGMAAAASGALLAGCFLSLVTVRTLTFGDIGPYELSRPTERVFDDRGSVNRLLIAASRQPDVCGLKVETHHLVWIGGHSFFHRDVPMYAPDGPPRDSGFFNYVIVPAGETVGDLIATDGPLVLRRLTSAVCRPDPMYDNRLPGYDNVRRLLGL